MSGMEKENSPLHNPKWEIYCQERARGKSQRQAMLFAYPSRTSWLPTTVDKRASELESNGEVKGRLASLQKAAADEAQWSLEVAIERTKRINDKAYEEVDLFGFVEKSPGPKAFFDSVDRLNKYCGIDKQIDLGGSGSDFPIIDTASQIPGCYADLWRDIMSGRHSEYIGESGRGSAKSTVLGGIAPIMLILKDPRLCGVAFRQVANTLRDSIFATMVASIYRLGVEDLFEWTVSPMLIKRKDTGQVILFRGLDDPEKAKSLTLSNPDMYFGFAVWEEFDQIRGLQNMRKVQQTVKRGGAPHFWTFRMFNTPANDAHWAHQYTLQQEERGDALVARFTYRDIPRDFLGEEFHADADALEEIDPEAHANEYMGICTGRKGKVFTNLERREITKEEREGFKWIRCGVDWGFVRDPWVFLQVAYDSKTKTIYFFNEDKGLRLSDEKTAGRVRKRLTTFNDKGEEEFYPRAPRNKIYADNADQKAVASYRACGLDCAAALKWPGSVEQGIKWMQTRFKIVIDKDCPLTWHEFSAYDYEADPDGLPIEDAYPDKDNHTIDAGRYALSPLIAKKKEV